MYLRILAILILSLIAFPHMGKGSAEGETDMDGPCIAKAKVHKPSATTYGRAEVTATSSSDGGTWDTCTIIGNDTDCLAGSYSSGGVYKKAKANELGSPSYKFAWARIDGYDEYGDYDAEAYEP
jgi:hypothetical protein